MVYIMSGGNDIFGYHDIADGKVMAASMLSYMKRLFFLGFRNIHVGNLPYLPIVPFSME